MITQRQMEFQNPPDADHLWVETLLFPIVVPEEHLYALVYVNIRPSLGVMWTQVMVCGTLTESRSDLLHYNENHFQPAPASLLDVETEVGLRIRCLKAPADFAIEYAHPDGTAIDVEWGGIMPPFDTHDPAHSPQAGSSADMHADKGSTGFGRAGHFDTSGRVTGSLTVRGRTYQVDSIERMDHSWGPRNPMKVPNMFIVSATFGSDLVYHMICPWDPDKTGADAFQLSHGYVVDGGEVYGLTSEARIVAEHHGLMCTRLEMDLVDVRGHRHRLEATPDIGAPWVAGPNAITHNALMRWASGDRRGYGVVMKNHSLSYLNARRGRFHDGSTAAIYV